MRLDEIATHSMDGAKAAKEYACRRGPHDIKPWIDVYRGDELVAQVFPREHLRNLILAAFRMSALGFDADAMAVTFECYDATDPMFNPLTGESWGAGELQDAVRNHQGLERGWVVEAVSVSCANRAGDLTFAEMPYRYAGKHLVWIEPKVMPAGLAPDGLMADAMIAAMNEPSMGTEMPYPDGELPRAQRDLAAAQAMMQSIPVQVGLLAEVDQSDRIRALRKGGGIQF